MFKSLVFALLLVNFSSQSVGQKCVGKDGITMDDLRALMHAQVRETYGFKCLVSCLLEEAGFIRDGQVQTELLAKELKRRTVDRSLDRHIEALAQVCSKVDFSDKCEAGISFVKCLKEGARRVDSDLYSVFPYLDPLDTNSL